MQRGKRLVAKGKKEICEETKRKMRAVSIKL